MYPKELSFSIEQETYLPAVEPSEGKEATPAEVFGPDYGGNFRLRWPTEGDLIAIESKVVAYFQRYGVSDPGANVSALTYWKVYALMFVGQLVIEKEKPAWFTEDAQADDKRRAAIRGAWTVAQRQMEDAKKKPEVIGVGS